MFAVIACLEDGGEPRLLATARTLRAAQKKMSAVQDAMAHQRWLRKPCRYRFIGLLTEDGLMNYHGERIKPTSLGYVTLKMGIDYD